MLELKKIYLIPLFGFGSTRNGKGSDAGDESAKLAALYQLVKETKEYIHNFQHKQFYQQSKFDHYH